MKPNWGRPVELGLWVLAAALAGRLMLFGLDVAARLSNGFAGHYTASRLLLEGAPPSRFYDDGWFVAQVQLHAGPVYDLYYPNPPTASLLMLPVAGLDYAGARAAWTAASLAFLVGVLWWLIRRLDLRGSWAPALAVLALLFQPLNEQLLQGQVYLAMLGLLVVAWYGYRRVMPAPAGIALGLMLGLKLVGPYLWLLLLAERRIRTLAWGAGSVALLALVSLPWVGVSAWRVYFGLLPAIADQPDLAVTAYQTQAGFLSRMLVYDPRWNPSPLLPVEGVAPLLAVAIFTAVVGSTLYATRWAQGSDLTFAMLVLANVIVGPLALDYQYTLALLPVALLLGWMRGQHGWRPWLVFALGVALIAADLPYRSPRLSAGAWALLAYPKLYGAWLLWGLAMWGCWKERKPRLVESGPVLAGQS